MIEYTDMKKLLIPLTLLLLFSCSKKEEHFISSPKYRYEVQKDLSAKIDALDGKIDINTLLAQCASLKEREAMEWLYAYMPLGDVADYPASFYLKGVRSAFSAMQEMPWGADIPEDIFRHFVLPVRVNNENLDDAREVFYEELKDRVKGLSMYDAALEVNHWCHEKVIYTPSDGRTSSPLASVRTAYGRCGEESVLAVTALRSVGIPSRQVYTPRWAHTDDNHAWVEVWVEGKWYYLGACEPEPKLNVAWFSATAQRALLMHSKVFGRYNTKEDIITQTDCYTEINVTSNYAPTAKVEVKIIDKNGAPVSKAKVEYKIYNYAELYSAITKTASRQGRSSATFGKGDIIVWASKDSKIGFRKISVGATPNPVVITLDKKIGESIFQEIDIIPPVETKAQITLTPAEIASNAARLAVEDSIRGSYTSTFAKEKDANISKYSSSERKEIYNFLNAARGNWTEILNFISSRPEGKYKTGLVLLDLISAKDLRDTPSDILTDHLDNYVCSVSNTGLSPNDPISVKYILNPRIANELLTPWRSALQKIIKDGVLGVTDPAPKEILEFTKKIKVLDQYNPQHIPMSPTGVLSLMAADLPSRDIFFVALCRSAGYPARLEEVSGKLQYYHLGRWNDVSFDEDSAQEESAKGSIVLSYSGETFIDDPKFDTHFTIAKIDNGSINTLNFRDKEGYEGTASYKDLSSKPVVIDQGWYMLTTGTRMASGKVLATVSFFNVIPDQTYAVRLIMREDKNDLQVIGNMNPEDAYSSLLPDGTQIRRTILETTGRGFFFLVFARANHEPSTHAIRSLYEKSPNRPTIIFFNDYKEYTLFKTASLPEMPLGISLGIDQSGNILKSILKEMKINSPEYPVVVIADSFGRIVYISEGYNIGTAEQLSRIAK